MPGTPSDFFSQIPTAIIVMLGSSCMMLFASVALIIIRRGNKLRRQRNGIAEPPPQPNPLGELFKKLTAARPASPSPTQNIPTLADEFSPDLDMLLAMTDPKTDTPAAPTVAPSAPAVAPLRQPSLVNVRLSHGRTVVEAVEVLIVLKERRTEQLIVQIGDDAYMGTEPNIPPEFRQRFVKTMKELASVAPTLSKGAKPSAGTSAATESTESASTPAAPKTLTLAEQIELFLQQKLATMPEHAARSIHVRNAPDGGVRIEVDGQSFANIGEITDADVKKLISETINEWQQSQKK